MVDNRDMGIETRPALPQAVPITLKQRLPATLFVLGGLLCVVSLFADWTVIHPGSSNQVGPLAGYQKDPIVFFALFLLVFTVRSVVRDWYSIGPRTLAIFTTAVAMTGQFSAYLDIVSQARYLQDVPRFLPGYYIGMAGLVTLVLASVVTFRTPED